MEEAERSGAQLLVVGNVGINGLGRVLGSVAWSVVHNAPCDVLVATLGKALGVKPPFTAN